MITTGKGASRERHQGQRGGDTSPPAPVNTGPASWSTERRTRPPPLPTARGCDHGKRAPEVPTRAPPGPGMRRSRRSPRAGPNRARAAKASEVPNRAPLGPAAKRGGASRAPGRPPAAAPRSHGAERRRAGPRAGDPDRARGARAAKRRGAGRAPGRPPAAAPRARGAKRRRAGRGPAPEGRTRAEVGVLQGGSVQRAKTDGWGRGVSRDGLTGLKIRELRARISAS